MKRLARLFSLLMLFAILGAVAAVIWLRPLAPKPPVVLPPLAGSIDRIVVEKSARRMTLYQGDQAMRVYPIALGFSPSDDKERQGDGRTPEGHFTIDRRNDTSAYHLSLGINYPRAEDISRAEEGGYDPGGDIFFHGQPNQLESGHLLGDWTAGCIALTNDAIREVWAVTPIGTAVEIRP